MSPLASVMLLAFFFLIVISLLVWALLTPRGRAEREREPPRDAADAPAPPEPEERVRVVRASNDELRGAKAAPKRPAMPDDAFERFLRSGRDDER